MIASDIIDSYIKSLAFLRQNKEYRRLRNRFRKVADRKRRHTNNPFKPLFIDARFLTKHFLKSQLQNLREQIFLSVIHRLYIQNTQVQFVYNLYNIHISIRFKGIRSETSIK